MKWMLREGVRMFNHDLRRDFLRATVLGCLMPLIPVRVALAAGEAEDRLTGDLRRAWELLAAGDQEATVKFVDHSLGTFQAEAQDQARAMTGFAAAGKELEFHKVNIAGTLHYIRALAFQRAGKRDEWLTALRKVWTEYPFSRAWDPKGWFWKPGQAAKKEGYIFPAASR
ncbi:MAG: hypothetical protein V4726_01170 [Verrucomicrobiota bacterium]